MSSDNKKQNKFAKYLRSILPLSNRNYDLQNKSIEQKITELQTQSNQKLMEQNEWIAKKFEQLHHMIKEHSETYRMNDALQKSLMDSEKQAIADMAAEFKISLANIDQSVKAEIGRLMNGQSTVCGKVDAAVSQSVELQRQIETRLTDQIQQFEKGIEEGISAQTASMEELLHNPEQEEMLKAIRGFSSYVKANLLDKKVYYMSSYDHSFNQETFGKGFDQIPNFNQRFLDLVRGLDQQSIETVVSILARLEKALKSDDAKMDLYTKEEQDELLKQRIHFKDVRLSLSEDQHYIYNTVFPILSADPSALYYRHGLDMLTTIETIKHKDIIDAGAYIGDSASVLSKLTDKNVYSFEPSPQSYQYLLKTIEMNHLDNVIAQNMAISNSSDGVEFSVCTVQGGSSYKTRENMEYMESIQVPSTTIDEFAEANHLEVGLIKSDVEGAEQDLLQGALQTIRKYKPILLISIYHNENDFFDIKPMIEKLDLGYQFKIVKPVNHSMILETMLIAEVRD